LCEMGLHICRAMLTRCMSVDYLTSPSYDITVVVGLNVRLVSDSVRLVPCRGGPANRLSTPHGSPWGGGDKLDSIRGFLACIGLCPGREVIVWLNN
jgi:hypothetical protein